jgi:hypothetical protein
MIGKCSRLADPGLRDGLRHRGYPPAEHPHLRRGHADRRCHFRDYGFHHVLQQVSQHRAVMDVRRRRHHRMDHLALPVHAEMRLRPKIPLVALLGLVHVGVSRFLLVLGRTRRVDDAGIDNRAAGKPYALGLQMLAAQIDADKSAHRKDVVQRFLGRRVGKVEPLLQAINSQHPLQPNSWAASAAIGIMRRD